MRVSKSLGVTGRRAVSVQAISAALPLSPGRAKLALHPEGARQCGGHSREAGPELQASE